MKYQLALGRRHPRTSSHLQACHDCAAAVRRERQYLERLRQAPIPPASNDLTARLLARTEELAASPAAFPAPKPAAGRVAARALAVTAGGTMAAAGVLAAGAFAVAGEPFPAAGQAADAAFSQVSASTPADGRALSAGRVSLLRAEGWACPELHDMGFRLESAKATMLNGAPAVELNLSDGTHYATVTEQRITDEGGSVGTGANVLEVRATSPWTADYRTPGHIFHYESDLPAGQADDAVPLLARAGGHTANGISAGLAEGSAVPEEESAALRLQRGINKIVAVFTR